APAPGHARDPHLFEERRARRAAGRLRDRRSRARGLARARAPSLQREPARRGGRARRARRPRAPRAHLAAQRRGARLPDPRAEPERGQLPARGAGSGHLRAAAARGRDRAPAGRLRHARARAHHGGPARGERAAGEGAAPDRRGARVVSQPPTPRFQRIAVLGLGLLGGSLAAAARARGLAGEVVGPGRRADPLARARARGLVDRVTRDPAEAVAGADLVVLACPVGAMAPVLAAAAEGLAPGALVTDVGSVKAVLADTLPGLLPPGATY